MKKIPLTRGFVTLVDDDVYEWTIMFKWHAHVSKGKVYAMRRDVWTKVFLHREIVKPEPHELVDHRHGNGLDNRRENLRVASKD